MSGGPIDVEPDQQRIYGDQLDLFCSCDVPSPIVTEGVDGPECASCRKTVVT